jgi:hypothetical protein
VQVVAAAVIVITVAPAAHPKFTVLMKPNFLMYKVAVAVVGLDRI